MPAIRNLEYLRCTMYSESHSIQYTYLGQSKPSFLFILGEVTPEYKNTTLGDGFEITSNKGPMILDEFLAQLVFQTREVEPHKNSLDFSFLSSAQPSNEAPQEVFVWTQQ